MKKRTVVVRDRVAQAVAGWHAKQKIGMRVTASEAADAVRAMYAMPEVGSGPAIVAMLLVDNHGWERDGRNLWLPPQMPVKLATPAPIVKPAPIAMRAEVADVDLLVDEEITKGITKEEFRKYLGPRPPDDPNLTI